MAADVISRQATIDRIKHHKAYMEEHNDTGESLDIYLQAHDHICEIISMLPSAQQWVPCEERLPEKPYGCLVTVWDENPMTGEMFENLLPYFVGWDGEQWNDYDGQQCPFEVIAWQYLPKPYTEGDHT